MGRPQILLGALLGAALAVVASSCGGSDVTCAPAGRYVPAAVRSADPGDCPATVPQPTWGNLSVMANEMCGSSTERFNEGGSGGGPGGPMWCAADGTTVLTGTTAGISGKSVVVVTSCTTTTTCTANYDLTYARQ